METTAPATVAFGRRRREGACVDGAVQRKLLKFMVCGVAVAVRLVALYANHGSLEFRCGRLPAANDPYLDGTGRVFQTVSWHLGNATRTWGETYGVKIGRCYVSMGVTHINPLITVRAAREDD